MNNYDKAVRAIVNRRRTDLDEALIAWRDALDSDARLFAAYSKYQDEVIKSAKGEDSNIHHAKKMLRSEMKRLGLSEATFNPPPRCKICEDTGYSRNGYCRCVVRMAIDSDKANLTLPALSFDECNVTAPAPIKPLYGIAADYINSYPDGEKVFFNIIGESGTGKTVLASAIASAFMERGASAVTLTAFEFTRRALDYHTQFKIENYVDRFTPMLDCDILVIDDLGKESMFKNVTVEYLYSVIDERWRKKKYTVITSNLSPDAIIKRYGEAITSRLLDKNIALNFTLSAKNNRLS